MDISSAMLTEACSSISESIFGLRRTCHEGIMLVVERDVSLWLKRDWKEQLAMARVDEVGDGIYRISTTVTLGEEGFAFEGKIFGRMIPG